MIEPYSSGGIARRSTCMRAHVTRRGQVWGEADRWAFGGVNGSSGGPRGKRKQNKNQFGGNPGGAGGKNNFGAGSGNSKGNGKKKGTKKGHTGNFQSKSKFKPDRPRRR